MGQCTHGTNDWSTCRLCLLDRLYEVTHGAHYVDIVTRRGGQDHHYDGDFLRYVAIVLRSPAAGATPKEAL